MSYSWNRETAISLTVIARTMSMLSSFSNSLRTLVTSSVEALRARGVVFLDTPDTYYDAIDRRLPGHGEDVARLRRHRILIDGAPESRPGAADGGLLLQIFTKTVIGPIFFEIIQRKGDEGFGEGNFRALFESIEADQVRRGVLKA